MKKLLLITCGLSLSAAVEAQIIHVPGDYPTIQQGIEAATNGDTVLVSDGMYYEQINFLGKKPLMVASEFLMDGDTNHIANTIIDGSQLTKLDSTSVVYFGSGEDTTSILCGFTIQHGKGTSYSPGNGFRGGGGIFIAGSGAKIVNNRITENHLSDTIFGSATVITGAGIHYKWEENDDWVVIDHNVIDHNSCYSSGGEAGSVGADIASNARISYNTFANNEAIANESCHALGAAFCCWTDPSWNDTVTAYIHHNVIKNNLAIATNNFAEGAGGMIWLIIGKFTDNIVENNEVVSNFSLGGGAGLYIWRPLEGTVVCNNTFRENNCNKFGGALCVESYANNPNVGMVFIENNYFLDNHASKGGAFVTLNNPVTLYNNVFSLNNSDDIGGAVYLTQNATSAIPHLVSFVNNSFYNNKASHNGGAIYSNNARPLIFNSIFWADTAVLANEIYEQSSDTIEIGFSNIDPDLIQGGFFMDGGGNINEDPLFEDLELLTISENSPCVNTGTEEYICHCGDLNECPHYDIIGTYRPHAGFVDMGAYEVDFGTGIKPHAFQPNTDWHSVYPNPFTDQAVLSYELDSKTKVEINLYNSSGELIQTMLSEQQEAGKQELQFSSGNLPAGVYFYRIITDTKQATGRMILMK
jgi:predicted outer membrane repeat protein